MSNNPNLFVGLYANFGLIVVEGANAVITIQKDLPLDQVLLQCIQLLVQINLNGPQHLHNRKLWNQKLNLKYFSNKMRSYASSEAAEIQNNNSMSSIQVKL